MGVHVTIIITAKISIVCGWIAIVVVADWFFALLMMLVHCFWSGDRVGDTCIWIRRVVSIIIADFLSIIVVILIRWANVTIHFYIDNLAIVVTIIIIGLSAKH